jgi:hypothetical protein
MSAKPQMSAPAMAMPHMLVFSTPEQQQQQQQQRQPNAEPAVPS